LTGEYPPQPGGVSDYTARLAAGLAAAGDAVEVWCPAANGSAPPAPPGVTVRRELGRLRPVDLRRAGALLDRRPRPRRLLLQWVPHGFGCRSLNVPFCAWLARRASRRGDRVEVMVHEAFSAFGEGTWRQDAAAAVHRVMTVLLLRAARRVWVSTPAWADRWRPYALGRRARFGWLPVPSNVPVRDDPAAAAEARASLTPAGGPLLGHFGTFGRPVADMLAGPLARLLLDRPALSAVLLGRGGEALRSRLCGEFPALAPRLHAAGGLDAAALSAHLQACDVLLQPFPDGASGRRTSLMAGLAHGRAVVTTPGPQTEPVWSASRAVALAEPKDEALAAAVAGLLDDPARRGRLAAAGRELYQSRFDLCHAVAALRGG
jgi:glycosyltransferase involved in cell wall biosynthesis